MRPKLSKGVSGNRGNQTGVEVTYKISIYNLKVTSVTSVTSIFFLAREAAKNMGISYQSLSITPLCKNEVTEVTEVTRHQQIGVFWLPLSILSYLWLPPKDPTRVYDAMGKALEEFRK